jgi:hypothetical protein
LSYPALYLHRKIKHNGQTVKNTVIPEKNITNRQVTRGRPKKIEDFDFDEFIRNDPIKTQYTAEDEFWRFLGIQG